MAEDIPQRDPSPPPPADPTLVNVISRGGTGVQTRVPATPAPKADPDLRNSIPFGEVPGTVVVPITGEDN